MNEMNKLVAVLDYLKKTFVGKDEIIDLLGISMVARENLFLLGPPGTAKSAIVRQLSACLDGGNNFEYLLTRFTEPNEIFGPFDIRKLRDGELSTNTEGMMPEASLVFLDEIFNANSAILNSLLTALNERIFRRGKESRRLPALIFIGASNQLPEEESLAALLDRFLVRVKCDYVDPDKLMEVLLAGWNLDSTTRGNMQPSITPADILHLQQECRNTDLSPIRQSFVDVVHSLRNTGIKVSDRRAVKLQNLIAASAMICGRTAARLSDLWVLKYIWDTEEQMEILEGMINSVIEKDIGSHAHPLVQHNHFPDAEELMKEVVNLSKKWASDSLSYEEKNVIKDKLRYVQTRCDWIRHNDQRTFVKSEIEKLWQQILQAVPAS
ncbi:AAA family ATPase [Flavihumibacter solisilvae]|uniref:ATPase n=1 Tax=Flavihumibacter solisilvae TaxID=1349421 RepID=A0A0C1IQ74_9BACT|nr:AAA family ATPase [Flavihumibacter solisilvae]KIC92614.1 ATPase [Flavihumibacter solisilvae]